MEATLKVMNKELESAFIVMYSDAALVRFESYKEISDLCSFHHARQRGPHHLPVAEDRVTQFSRI